METADLVLTIAVVIEFVVGIILNMNILLVNIGKLRNGLSLGPSDRVHLTKALVNVSMHLAIAAQYGIHVFRPYLLFLKETFGWNVLINIFLIFYSYWLTAVLCVYYCTNITNCGHRWFVWLKRSLSSYLLLILLGSGLGSVAISCPIFCICSIVFSGNSIYQSMVIQSTFVHNVIYRTIVAILGSFLPFTIAFISTTITSWSLISHIWRMKQNNQGFTSSKLQPQINSTRTMILFLLIAVIYFVIQTFFTSLSANASNAKIIFSWLVIATYPISEAIIIIQSSSKLRSTLLGKFLNWKTRNSEAET